MNQVNQMLRRIFCKFRRRYHIKKDKNIKVKLDSKKN